MQFVRSIEIGNSGVENDPKQFPVSEKLTVIQDCRSIVNSALGLISIFQFEHDQVRIRAAGRTATDIPRPKDPQNQPLQQEHRRCLGSTR